jgi:hypothetical protein
MARGVPLIPIETFGEVPEEYKDGLPKFEVNYSHST